MSMNIIVPTVVKKEEDFSIQNEIYPAGTILISNDKSQYFKLANGIDTWENLSKCGINSEILTKWKAIAQGSINSHLVTLPDLNFAYSIVDTNNISDITQIVQKVINDQNSFLVKVSDGIEFSDSVQRDSVVYASLTLEPLGTQELIFKDLTQADSLKISKLNLYSKDKSKYLKCSFVDEEARFQNESNWQKIINLELSLKTLDLENWKNDINKRFELGELMPNYTGSDSSRRKSFLNANKTWIELNASSLIYEGNTTIKTKIDSISNSINNINKDSVKISSITSSAEKNQKFRVLGIKENDNNYHQGDSLRGVKYDTNVYITNGTIRGAAYNDYAEARVTNEKIEAGRVVVENGDDTLSIAKDRLQLGANIVSDTFGMLIGETDNARTPIALCGRVLAYPYEDRDEFYPGAPVCSGPNGTVSLMSKEEVLHYPECIIGYVSAIPTYETWNEIEVKQRIWIKVL